MDVLYRKNVAAILQDADSNILVGERRKIKDSWQFPQGGIDDGETPLQALHRELEEEIGVKPDSYRVMERRDGYRYTFADGRLKYGKYGGQEQVYFLCAFLGQHGDIVTETAHPEFRVCRWIKPEAFKLDWVPDFKKEVYKQVFRDFFDVELA